MYKTIFDEFGNLNGGIITNCSIQEIEKYLVNGFPSSNTRKRNFLSFKKFINTLDWDVVSKIWIDGSFCSNKENPQDIDCVIFLRYSIDSNNYAINIMQQEATFVDRYVTADIDSIDNDSTAYKRFLRQEKYWLGQFGFDRNRHRKAIIEIRKEDII